MDGKSADGGDFGEADLLEFLTGIWATSFVPARHVFLACGAPPGFADAARRLERRGFVELFDGGGGGLFMRLKRARVRVSARPRGLDTKRILRHN